MAATTYARSRQGMRREQPALRVEDAVNLTLDQPRGGEIPDIIEFTTSPDYLNRTLYPRQATLLKVIFLQTELFTDYDYKVIAEWTKEFHLPPEANRDEDKPLVYQGDWGIQPDVLERIEILKSQGRKWFKEVLAVIGRRGGKGYLGAICGAYVLWHYVCTGDPQEWYGIDRDKRLAALVFAGKKDQAKQNQWRDLVQVIINAPCFREHPLFRDLLSRALAESLTLFAPVQQRKRDIIAANSSMDIATFEILPKEATPMAGRGPATYCLDPETPVLTTDLAWVPIGKLEPGDHVIGIDEYPTRKGEHRKLRDAEVQHVWRTWKPALRFTFEDGSQVVCSEDHQWLKKDHGSGGATRWRPARSFRVGNMVKSVVDPWERLTTHEAGYLRGFFDGEATIPRSVSKDQVTTIIYSQNPGPVLDEVHRLLDDLGYSRKPNGQGAYPSTPEDRSCEQWALRGVPDCLRFMGEIDPIRLRAKARLLWEGRSPRGDHSETGRYTHACYKRIVSIEHLPEQELVDIQTSTRTFIANGLISHNCLYFDEMAHVVATGANRGADEIYESSTPSLDQFGGDGFIYAGSSPWQMIGKFYELCQQALEVEHDTEEPVYPSKLLIQLESWAIYEDWEQAHLIKLVPDGYARRCAREGVPFRVGNGVDAHGQPLRRRSAYYLEEGGRHKDGRPWYQYRCFKRLKRAPQTYDDEMRKLERANPETFAVERRSKWAAALDTYLKPEFVDRMFLPWPEGRTLTMQTKGVLNRTYVAHGDPSKSGANFGWAIGHIEGPDEQGLMHVVFDKIHFWAPFHFEDGQIDYPEIGRQIGDDIEAFIPEVVTFDQFNSVEIMQRLDKRARSAHLPKRVSISEETATRPKNWAIAETFKTALGMNLIHAPYIEQLELEAKFLQDLGGKVDHPTMGPVQTKDVWDAVANVVYHLIGDQMTAFMAGEFRQAGIRGSGGPGWPDQEGYAAEPQEDRETFEALGSFARRRQAAQTAHLPSTQRARRRR